nr:integrase, catalytic region, zinc finger, CCHC-type, peptidase aspartic, catalytic [Tanacetum cinerariifolium]
ETIRKNKKGGVILGPDRPRTYDDLSENDKKRFDADVHATNIVLQGLPKDIYKLINHNIEAKAIWDNVKVLLAGFHKLVNDIRNIRMTMPNIMLNSKFVNNMSLEWDSPVSFQAGPFHASILSEKPDLKNNIDHVGEIHDEHEILNEVQQTSVVDSDSVDMAEVDQNAIDKKCDKIERKNLLITNENLIANCLARDVFYTVINSTLTAYRFHDLSATYNVPKTRAVELEAENFKLNEKINKMIMIPWTDYESWAQRIGLYYKGKESGVYILLSIDEGPVQLGTTRETIRKTKKGGVILGPDRPCTYDDLSENDKKRFDVDVHATNIVLQGLPKDIYKLIYHNIEAKAIWDNIKVLLAGFELTKED